MGRLIRQSDPRSTCLGPEPGKGHWEHQNLTECPRCGPVEEEVSAYLSERAYFRCVRVDDIDLRKRLEKALIATVAQCPVCRPSDTWLGKYAYAGQVWSTGLWNAQHTGDRPTSDEDLRHFDALAQESRDVATPRQRSIQARADLSDTLLVVPCSGGKKGASVLDLPVRRVADYLDPAARPTPRRGKRPGIRPQGCQHRPSFAPPSCHRHVLGPAIFNTMFLGVCSWRHLTRIYTASSSPADTVSSDPKSQSTSTRRTCRPRQGAYGPSAWPVSFRPT